MRALAWLEVGLQVAALVVFAAVAANVALRPNGLALGLALLAAALLVQGAR